MQCSWLREDGWAHAVSVNTFEKQKHSCQSLGFSQIHYFTLLAGIWMKRTHTWIHMRTVQITIPYWNCSISPSPDGISTLVTALFILCSLSPQALCLMNSRGWKYIRRGEINWKPEGREKKSPSWCSEKGCSMMRRVDVVLISGNVAPSVEWERCDAQTTSPLSPLSLHFSLLSFMLIILANVPGPTYFHLDVSRQM